MHTFMSHLPNIGPAILQLSVKNELNYNEYQLTIYCDCTWCEGSTKDSELGNDCDFLWFRCSFNWKWVNLTKTFFQKLQIIDNYSLSFIAYHYSPRASCQRVLNWHKSTNTSSESSWCGELIGILAIRCLCQWFRKFLLTNNVCWSVGIL